MSNISIKKKEAKTITFTITDSSGNAVDVSGATLTFAMKEKLSDTTALVEIADGSFDKSQGASGIVSCVLTDTHTDRTGQYLGQLKISFSASNIDKSDIITIDIADAITD